MVVIRRYINFTSITCNLLLHKTLISAAQPEKHVGVHSYFGGSTLIVGAVSEKALVTPNVLYSLEQRNI